MVKGQRHLRRVVEVIGLACVFLLAAAASSFAGHALPYHWADNDPTYPRGYIYWVDETGPEWPAYSSAIEWDKEPRLDAVYTSSEASCPSHCVSVVEAPMGGGCNDWGVMDPSVNAGGHLTGNTVVKVESGCSTTLNYADRRETICHEMGHSIGLAQRPATAPSCMRDGEPDGAQLPNKHDYDILHAMYNHND